MQNSRANVTACFLLSRKEKTENGQSVRAVERNNRVLLFDLHLSFSFAGKIDSFTPNYPLPGGYHIARKISRSSFVRGIGFRTKSNERFFAR